MSKSRITFEQQVGARISDLRRRAGLLQADLASHLKVTVSTVSHYEAGINMPQLSSLVQIADFFGVSVDYLLGQTELMIDWKTFRRKISLMDGTIVSLEAVINKFMSLSEQSQADVCRLIGLFALDDRLNHNSVDLEKNDFDVNAAQKMICSWLNSNE